MARLVARARLGSTLKLENIYFCQNSTEITYKFVNVDIYLHLTNARSKYELKNLIST